MRDRLASIGVRDAAFDDLAGSSAIVTGFDSGVPSVSIETVCRANRGSSIMRITRRSRPAPRMVNRPSASLDRRLGPGRQDVCWDSTKTTGPSMLSRRWLGRFAGTSRPIVWTMTVDALDRPAIHVEQATLDDLLGSECDVNVGPVGVGVELDPAGP